MYERWVGNWTNCNILTPSSFVFSSTSFSFCWAAQSRVLRAYSTLLGAGSLYSILSPTNWLQLTELPVAPGYIIVWHPPASCERRICTQFNLSTVKVIPWYLDRMHLFLDRRLGLRSICYINTIVLTQLQLSTWPKLTLNWTGPSQVPNSTGLASSKIPTRLAYSQVPNWRVFQNAKFPSLLGMMSFTLQSISYLGFIMTIVIVISSVRERKLYPMSVHLN